MRSPHATALGPDIPKTTPPNGITGSPPSRDPEPLAGQRAGRKVAGGHGRALSRLATARPFSGGRLRRAQAR